MMVAEALRRAGFPRMAGRLSSAAPDGEDTFAELDGEAPPADAAAEEDLGPVLGPWFWVQYLPFKLYLYTFALFMLAISVIVEHVSGDEDFAYKCCGKGYEEYWTENPFFTVWGCPLFRV